MKKDRLKEQDVIIGAILTVLSSVIYFLIRCSELHTLSRGEIGLSPAFFPELAFLFLIISSVILLISSLVKPQKQDNTEITQRVDRTQIRQVGIILLLLLAYISLIDVLGYYISSICTLFTLMLVYKVRGWYKILLISTTIMAVVFLFFEKGLRVPLPRGFLF